MILILLFLQVILVCCQDMREYDNVIIRNLRRREQIPLNRIYRRFNANGDDLNYRRTKDIREPIQDKRYETYLQMSDLQKAEKFKEEAREDLEKLQRELKWYTVDENNGIES